MNVYRYEVFISAETEDQADQVMVERCGCDEDYGFTYSIAWVTAGMVEPSA